MGSASALKTSSMPGLYVTIWSPVNAGASADQLADCSRSQARARTHSVAAIASARAIYDRGRGVIRAPTDPDGRHARHAPSDPAPRRDDSRQPAGARAAPTPIAVGAFAGGELVAVGFIATRRRPRRAGASAAWRRSLPRVVLAPAAAILAALIGPGHGRSTSHASVWCNARTPARLLYERAGMQTVSAEFEPPGDRPLRPTS